MLVTITVWLDSTLSTYRCVVSAAWGGGICISYSSKLLSSSRSVGLLKLADVADSAQVHIG